MVYKILVIEDETNLRENISEILELTGHTVITASNGKEGVFKAYSNNPDLILCDNVFWNVPQPPEIWNF